MGDLTRTGSNFNEALPNREALSEAEIDRRLSQPTGASSGVVSIQRDAHGNTIEASNRPSTQRVMLGGGSPSNLQRIEINHYQGRMDELNEAARRANGDEAKLAVITREMREIERSAKDLKAKEQQDTLAAEAQVLRASDQTMTNLQADLEKTQRDAADRKDRPRGKIML